MTLALLVVFALGGGPAKPGTIRWEHRLEDALKKAKSSGKPVMIDFWAEWCGWCHRLDQTTYVDPEVSKLITSSSHPAYRPPSLQSGVSSGRSALAKRFPIGPACISSAELMNGIE